jgi:F-type H+-transporting ATPase subunit epsilon
MQPPLLHLKILLPFEIFADETRVTRIVAETHQGSFGILPRRLDCVAALSAGILTYETENSVEIFVAVDEGVLTKVGFEVTIAVRNAIAGNDLSQLRETVKKQFLSLNETEQEVRSVVAKMESSLIRRLVELNRD